MSGTYSSFINVKSHGATGNGSTDDTASIRSAITVLMSNLNPGGTLYFPQGTYLVSGTLDLSTSTGKNIQIVGDGVTQSLLTTKTNSITLLNYTSNPTGGSVSFQVENLGFFGQGGATGVTAIAAAGSSGLGINSVFINNINIFTVALGISVSYSQGNRIGNIRFLAVVAGIYLNNAADTNVTNVFLGANASSTGPAIELTGTVGALIDQGIYLSNIDSNGQAIGLQIVDQVIGSAINCSFSSASNKALSMQATKPASTADWSFSSCLFESNTSSGNGAIVGDISNIQNVQRVAFSACYFEGNVTGLVLRGSHHTVTNCVFADNNGFDLLLDGAMACVITGNVLDTPTPTTNFEEINGANYNNVSTNVARSNIAVTGSHSISTNNLNTSAVP